MVDFEIIKEYAEEKRLLEIAKKHNKEKRIKAKIESLKELEEEYYNNISSNKNLMIISFDLALRYYELFEKQKRIIFLEAEEEAELNYIKKRIDFEGKPIQDYKNYINKMYAAYKNNIENIKTKGKIYLNSSTVDMLAIENILQLNRNITKEFFRLSYLYIRYSGVNNNNSKENKNRSDITMKTSLIFPKEICRVNAPENIIYDIVRYLRFNNILVYNDR